MSIPRSLPAINLAALQSNIAIATFTQPTVAVQRPSATRAAVRFLARWALNSAALTLAVLVLALAAHRALLGLWLHEGLMPETILWFLVYLAALCVNVGFALTLTLNRMNRRGGRRHV
ncbi:hypothetical protein [Tahibacter harae]|uniref:Uncharacterized protein n=1 Tax=Tahibacter harae TaxID=2963937 RepID=A0ABT1QR08_9GAMM|nr:hypothetical protein [Tahibacter harae]MCQ4164691.1 hypothetical protein [Tahibacter harae]